DRRAALRERRLRGSESGQRYAVGRARHIVEPELMAEGDRLRLAAVLAADAHLQVGLRRPPALDADPHQVADTTDVERLEGIALEHSLLEVEGEELSFGVVAGKAERRLRQVVRPEREEVGLLGNLVGPDAR